jgi:predicted DNA-binding transcriptional regulator YafY
MIDRDIKYLGTLGIVIERSTTRPPMYILRGGPLMFNGEELRTLGFIRDTFGPHTPVSPQVQTLLERLTHTLTEHEHRLYTEHQALHMPLQPAIDYRPYEPLIAEIQAAMTARQRLTFFYQSLSNKPPTHHSLVEPHEIEYYERHFYLVAYSPRSRRSYDFRIDRIQYDHTFERGERLPPGMEHTRQPITFRYRLAALLARGDISQRFAQQHIVERLPNGDVIIEAQGRSDFFIRRTLLKYAGNAELLEPDWLRRQMREEVEQMARLYE